MYEIYNLYNTVLVVSDELAPFVFYASDTFHLRVIFLKFGSFPSGMLNVTKTADNFLKEMINLFF